LGAGAILELPAEGGAERRLAEAFLWFRFGHSATVIFLHIKLGLGNLMGKCRISEF